MLDKRNPFLCKIRMTCSLVLYRQVYLVDLVQFSIVSSISQTEVSVQGAPDSLVCWVGIPVYLDVNSKIHLSQTEVSVQGAPDSLGCSVGIPVYVVFNSRFYLSQTEVSVQGAPDSLVCWVVIPFYLVLTKFHLLQTEVSVQGAPVSFTCWVGIPVYIVLIVSSIYHRLKSQSRELLSPLLAGLESQFIQV